MKKSYKDLFKRTNFPDVLAPDEEKAEEVYGLNYAKRIEYDWFNKTSGKGCAYYDRRDRFHELRLYARGKQNTDIYKRLLNGDEATYTTYDWRPLQVLPKFVKLIVNQMTERLFDVKAEAIDKFSTDLKEEYKQNLESYIYARPAMEKAKKHLGIDLMPENSQELPENQDEVDLYMQLKYKPAIEIACEEALKYTLDLNDYDETQSRIIEDITTLGMGALKHNTDPTKGITVDWVDPACLVHSYVRHRNFKDSHYYGEVDRITLGELKRVSGNKFTDEELKDIAAASNNWSSYHGHADYDPNFDRESNVMGNMIDVMYFTFKSTKTLSYKKKYNPNGGFKMTKKESTFTKTNESYTGYDVVKKVIDVWYEGTLIMGTDKIYNYGLCKNMIRPDGYLHRTEPNYVVYAPDLYMNEALSTVEKCIPYIDLMQQVHIKMQQLIAKVRPSGIYIDVSGLNEITMGDGNVLTPLEALKIYDETGNVLGTTSTVEGDYNHGREPIKELNNGVVQGLDRLVMAYNQYLNQIRDAIGIAQGADASMPHPDTLVGVQQMVSLNSNTATRHILDSGLNISQRLGRGLSLRLKDIFEYSDLKNAYINAIGKINVKTLEALKKLHLHDLGILIQLKPDAQEKQFLEGNINAALSKDSITLDDAIDVRNIPNTKLANELLKTRRARREKEKKQHEMAMEEARGKSMQAAAQATAQAKQQELQMKAQFEIQTIAAKSQAKMAELEKEAQVKAGLMEKEFQYNLQLNGMQEQLNNQKDKYKEDRKDERLSKQSTHQSKLIEQRSFNKRALKFESSEDNLSGSVELAEMEPS